LPGHPLPSPLLQLHHTRSGVSTQRHRKHVAGASQTSER
jgi:hypothetical protein